MEFTFVSGHPGLDLAGTVAHRASGNRVDLLDGPDAAGRWFVAAGLLDDAPAVDAEGLERVVALREAIYRLAHAHADGTPTDPADRELINRAAQPPPIGVQLLDSGHVARSGDLVAACSTVARATVELLGGPALDQLKACAGDGCTRLFLDSSRRRNRRWCDMAGCGNRAKAAAFRGRVNTRETRE